MRNGFTSRQLLGQRIFSPIQPTNKFGEKLREQVERRLTRSANDEDEVEQNEEIMDYIMDELRTEKLYFDSEEKFRKAQKKLSKKSKKVVEVEAVEAEAVEE